MYELIIVMSNRLRKKAIRHKISDGGWVLERVIEASDLSRFLESRRLIALIKQ